MGGEHRPCNDISLFSFQLHFNLRQCFLLGVIRPRALQSRSTKDRFFTKTRMPVFYFVSM
ncbi:MAG: hypothetical protein DYG86_17190 [Chloroflexi bacterium CFX2]|nr:hypothetical protein [Chloroflexi bacterium CFX2]